MVQANTSITAEHVEIFTSEFAKYDPLNTGYIEIDDVSKFVSSEVLDNTSNRASDTVRLDC